MSDKSSAAVLWWIGWIVLTIASFFVASSFWTPIVARHVGPMSAPSAPLVWVALVFGSWMVLLVPLIVVMYQKVDKAYEDARLARERATHEKNKALWSVSGVDWNEERRRLPRAIEQKLRPLPETISKGHLVHLKLKGGRRVEFAFVLNRKELLGLYNPASTDFRASDIQDIEPADLDRLPLFEAKKWLRLDGVGSAS